jgi:hypothetical protein
MRWSAKFQRNERATWEHAPVLSASPDSAWRDFSAWRLTTGTDYHAASVQLAGSKGTR